MFRERKEYRKSFHAVGQLYYGGELLQCTCYDVSVKGVRIEVLPGELLATVADFEALLAEDRHAEIFIEDLMIAGEVKVIWVKGEQNQIKMGLEFGEVAHNAEKLWITRREYRKIESFAADLIIEHQKWQVEGLNRSASGLSATLAGEHPAIKVDAPVKVQVKEFGLAALGKVVWVDGADGLTKVGLQILPIS